MATEFSRVIAPFAPPAMVGCQHEYTTPHKTGVVVGIPQGGTSMVAAAIDALGVPVSRDLYNFEADGRPNVGHDEAGWAAAAAELDAKLDVWGVKDTMVWRFSPETVHGLLRNPYYLVVARDVIAVTQRRCVNFEVTKPEQLFGVLKGQVEPEVKSMWDFVHRLPEAPLLLISYERALCNRDTFCEILATFLGLSPSPEEFQRAIARISPTGGYLTKDNGNQAN